MKSSLRKNLGNKNCEVDLDIRKQILDLYLAFTNADEQYSKVFDNVEFGYWSVGIARPLRLVTEISVANLDSLKNEKDDELNSLMIKAQEILGSAPFMDFGAFMKELSDLADNEKVRLTAKRQKAIRAHFTTVDENAEPVMDKDGKLEIDKNLSDTEQIPLTYSGGVNAFFEAEIKPYVPDAWVDEKSIVLGYELSFTKYFYKPVELRAPADIIADIQAIEASTDGLLASIVGGVKQC